MFQAGKLYIDQRCTELCVKVAGPSPEISSLSGMYILYCACHCEKLGKSFNIAAVLTDGDVDGLREGKNAVFYDRDGNDYTAKVVAIVDNPISIRQAFWAPYKKVARMINDKIDKAAAEKNEKSMNGLAEAADKATSVKLEGDPKQAPQPPVASTFDIAKIMGIFAAIGMAIGYIGQFFVAVFTKASSMPSWKLLVAIAVIMLVISGPSMFIAWRKLRKRDLGPVLNANGWAINAQVRINTAFGATLTSLAQYPVVTMPDPYADKKMPCWKKWLITIIVLGGIFCALYFTNTLKYVGLPFKKEQPEAVEQPIARSLDNKLSCAVRLVVDVNRVSRLPMSLSVQRSLWVIRERRKPISKNSKSLSATHASTEWAYLPTRPRKERLPINSATP